MSDCSLLFPIGTFHTNSFLCHPSDCTEVVCFWTLQYFRYVMIVGAICWRWCTPVVADMGVCCQCGPAESRHYHCCRRRRCDFVATCVVICTDSAVVACQCPRRRCRGRRRRGTTPPLPPTSVARLTTCVHWGAGWPRDGCPVAPPC